MKTDKSTYKVGLESELKTQLSKEWEDNFIDEINKKLRLKKLSQEEVKWIGNRRLEKEKEVNQKFELLQNEKKNAERELEREETSAASEQQVNEVIAPLKGIDPSIIKTKGILALVFVFMYDGITQSHPWSIKSTPKNEDETFEAVKKDMIKWINTIKFRDSDIVIHTVVPDIKPSDGLTAVDKRSNKHLPSNGWDNRYDLLIDNLKKLELQSKPKTFYAKRDKWKKSLEDYGMKNEKKRATLIEAIIQYRIDVQKDLDDLEKHDNRMKSIDLWVQKVPDFIKDLSQKLYYF